MGVGVVGGVGSQVPTIRPECSGDPDVPCPLRLWEPWLSKSLRTPLTPRPFPLRQLWEGLGQVSLKTRPQEDSCRL